MNTRCLLLPAAFVAAFLLTRSHAGDVSRAPRVNKTTAELLVGTWKAVTIDGAKVPAYCDLTIEFTEDEKLLIRLNVLMKQSRVTSGTYKLAGTTLWLTSPVEEEGNPVKTRDVTIKLLSEDNLVTALGPVKERERMVFQRVPKK